MAFDRRIALPNANGLQMPQIAFGAWTDKGSNADLPFAAALASGYQMIDTAEVYGSEDAVGRAVLHSAVPRQEIFVSTKISTGHSSKQEYIDAMQRSLDRLGFDYVDLFLIHGPTQHSPEGRLQCWAALEDLHKRGRVKAIGLSNFGVKQITAILENCTVKPSVNQIEIHPWGQQKGIVSFCQKNDIIVQSFSPLCHGKKFDDPTLLKITAEHQGKSPAQILLRWVYQSGFAFVTSSRSLERLKQVGDIDEFELTTADMLALDGLDGPISASSWGSFEEGECQ